MKILNKLLTLLILLFVLFQACDNSESPEPQKERDEEKEIYNPIIFESFDCFPQYNKSTLDVVTWNVEQYPLDVVTPGAIKVSLDTLKADIIAFQEVKNPDNLIEAVIDSLPDWEFVYADVRYDLELGFAYKLDEITSISSLKLLYPDNSNAFPREPVLITIEHSSGFKVNLINIHLKCCNDGVERRALASQLLKDYIDTNFPNEATILLGDFNDEISDANNPFSNFISDEANYKFADMEIANGDPIFWSYPSFGSQGSHIDHILISDELFDLVNETQTLKLDECIPNYEYGVSDHLPVMTSFKVE